MPSGGGGVYQPTTVSYEGQPVFSRIRNPKFRTCLLILMVCGLLGGVVGISCGMPYYLYEEEVAAPAADAQPVDKQFRCPCVERPLLAITAGVLMITAAVVALSVLIKITDFRRDRVCVCPFAFLEKNLQLSPKLHGQGMEGCNQGIISLNPCKDPFIPHPQYAGVSQMPTLRPEDEELRNLMPKCKECVSGNEESDRMLEPDPRIVLRPMGRVEDI